MAPRTESPNTALLKMGLATLITNKENALQSHPQVNLMETFFSIGTSLFPNDSSLCQADIKPAKTTTKDWGPVSRTW